MITKAAVESYERILRRVRQRVHLYEDAGRGEQAARVIRALKNRCMPYWCVEANERERARQVRLMRRQE